MNSRRSPLELLAFLALFCAACAAPWRRQLAQGDAALHSGQLAKAQAHYSKALKDAQAAPASREGKIMALNSLAAMELAQGKTPAAETHARGALAAVEACADCGTAALATALFNLASITATLGKAEEAQALYARALSSAEKTPDLDALEYSERLAEFGQFQLARGRYAEAETAYAKALARREKVLGPKDPTLAPLLEDLAAALQGQQKEQEAKVLEERARALGGPR